MTTVTGILDFPKGSEPRLRQIGDGLVEAADDPFMPPELIEDLNLRPAQQLTVEVGQHKPKRRRRSGGRTPRPVVEEILQIEGLEIDAYKALKPFEELTPIDPEPRMSLEHPGCPPACRLVDLFCPIGFGTRGLIVAPPKAGKTI